MHWLLIVLALGCVQDAGVAWLLARQTPWVGTNCSYWQLVTGDPWSVQAHEAKYYPHRAAVIDRSRSLTEDGNVIYFDIAAALTDELSLAGPSSLGHGPLSRSRLIRRAAENEDRNVVLWRVCGFQEHSGQVTFESIWTTCEGMCSDDS